MNSMEIGQKLVALCKQGKFEQATNELYSEKIVSIEAQDFDGMPARMEGIEAVRGKGQWWADNHEVHGVEVAGPFCGHRADQFAVHFNMDVTNKPSGERSQLNEVALYSVSGDKIVQEEFLYQAE